jgi:hypothetical protein
MGSGGSLYESDKIEGRALLESVIYAGEFVRLGQVQAGTLHKAEPYATLEAVAEG